MKIIFLNTWGGKLAQNIETFIQSHSVDTDIFCFQEAYESLQKIADPILSNFTKYNQYKTFISPSDDFPQTTYIRNNIEVIETMPVLDGRMDVGLGIYHKIKIAEKPLHLCNFHGRAFPGEKLDTPERIKQSTLLIKYFEDFESPKIIGGDFNLEFDTESVKMFEKTGYRNLIKDFKITNTRNKYVWERYPESKQYYADFVFVSPDVTVNRFEVIDNEVSDHLPLILDIDFTS